MKKTSVILLALILASCAGKKETKLLLQNPGDTKRVDAEVIIPRNEIIDHIDASDAMLPVLKDETGELIPTQLDDLDGDGSWDELFIVTDIDPDAELTASLSLVPSEEYPVFSARTNIRFAKKDKEYHEVEHAVRETHATNTITQQIWQMEGIAWENDKLGFRNYFDRRNGMDIFGKITQKMVLDEVGFKDNQSYHEFNPNWGVDVLKVGNSLGAGSIAYLYQDSLYRVGDNGSGTCDVVVEGPLRSIFRFDFPDWSMSGTMLNVQHEVCITAGKYYFSNKVTYTAFSEDLEFVTGIVNKKSDALHEVQSINGVKAFYTHDLQSEDTTLLGMGILIPEADFTKAWETSNEGEGIIQTYCIGQNAKAGQSSSYRFYSVWERENEAWKTKEGFEKLLTQEAKEMMHPVSYSFSK